MLLQSTSVKCFEKMISKIIGVVLLTEREEAWRGGLMDASEGGGRFTLVNIYGFPFLKLYR